MTNDSNFANSERARLDDVAAWYRGTVGFEGALNAASAALVAAAVPGRRALEIGPGEGLVLLQLAKHYEEVVAVEGASEYARLLERIVPSNVNLFECIIEEYDTDRQFDVVVLSHVLEHVEDAVGLLRQCLRLISDTGRVLIAVPNAGSIHRHVGVAMGVLPSLTALSENDHQIGHRRVYNTETLRQHIEAAGLVIDELRGHFVKPLSNRQVEDLPEEVQQAFVAMGPTLPVEVAHELFAICKKRG